jgi:hypothetical protein
MTNMEYLDQCAMLAMQSMIAKGDEPNMYIISQNAYKMANIMLSEKRKQSSISVGEMKQSVV